ncbi:MAG: rubrerythrin family protein [Muribaculaceae bacterium]|nr:rubrerythrin family protein [Muribaculaceae bacterium]
MSDTTSTPNLKGTRTERNLANAYVVESTAYTRYVFFAKTAKKEEYYHFANIFQETADNELHHAKIFLKYLTDGVVVTNPINVDPGVLKPTLECLKIAASEEENEGVKEYTQAAEVAEEEGFAEIADHFRAIASIENHHKERFDLMRWQIENDKVWKRDEPIKWQCLVCGYIFEGVEPPAKCPACNHPYQHFKPADTNANV